MSRLGFPPARPARRRFPSGDVASRGETTSLPVGARHFLSRAPAPRRPGHSPRWPCGACAHRLGTPEGRRGRRLRSARPPCRTAAGAPEGAARTCLRNAGDQPGRARAPVVIAGRRPFSATPASRVACVRFRYTCF